LLQLGTSHLEFALTGEKVARSVRECWFVEVLVETIEATRLSTVVDDGECFGGIDLKRYACGL